jgi:hypothetical protein
MKRTSNRYDVHGGLVLRARDVERQALRDAFAAALHADWKAQPYQGFCGCATCGNEGHQKGPSPRSRRCESCHAKTPAARRRARRNTR